MSKQTNKEEIKKIILKWFKAHKYAYIYTGYDSTTDYEEEFNDVTLDGEFDLTKLVNESYQQGQANLKAKVMAMIPDDETTEPVGLTGKGSPAFNRGFNYCRSQLLSNLKDLI